MKAESLGCNCEAEWEADVSWCELNKHGFAIIAEVEIEYRRLGEKRDNSYIEVNAFIERAIKSGESLGRVPPRKPIRLQLQFTPPCTLDLTSYYRPGALLSVGGKLEANVLSVTECNYEKWKIFANKDIAEKWNRPTMAPVCKQLLEEEGKRRASPFYCKWRWTPQFAWCTLGHTDIEISATLAKSSLIPCAYPLVGIYRLVLALLLAQPVIVAQIKLEEKFLPRRNDSKSYFLQAKVKITAVYKWGKKFPERQKEKILEWDPLPLRLRFLEECHPRFPTVHGHHIVKGELYQIFEHV
ncbi:unnamed protein product [Cylicocyclus nassatus]|uniref:Uncharacterized protein n=1 Tax=Cylicocyclus nassatus TaxID=53992 RepID=A0AA36GXK4_CYLNA|nr:unnamed protein product [Cylicocyclus nassatus]